MGTREWQLLGIFPAIMGWEFYSYDDPTGRKRTRDNTTLFLLPRAGSKEVKLFLPSKDIGI